MSLAQPAEPVLCSSMARLSKSQHMKATNKRSCKPNWLPFLQWVLKLPYRRSSIHECLLVAALLVLLTLNMEHGLAAGLVSATALRIWTMLVVVLTDVCCWSEESCSNKQVLGDSRKRVGMIPKAVPRFSDSGEKPLIYSTEVPRVCSCEWKHGGAQRGSPWHNARFCALPVKIIPVFLRVDRQPWNKTYRVNSVCCEY